MNRKLSDLWDGIKKTNTCIIGVLAEEEAGWGEGGEKGIVGQKIFWKEY